MITRFVLIFACLYAFTSADSSHLAWDSSDSTTTTIDDGTCSYSNSKYNVDFDLAPLMITHRNEESYQLLSNDDGYSYAWNVCGSATIESTPTDCLGRYGGVIQYNDEMCYIAGKFKKNSDGNIDLIDSNDPAKGVSISYADGDTCSSSSEVSKRSATINIYCADAYAKIVSVEEPRTCYYRVVMESYYACPLSCGITANGLCNGLGNCVYDEDIATAYCDCESGYYGDDCSSTTPVATSIRFSKSSLKSSTSMATFSTTGYSFFSKVLLPLLVFGGVVLLIVYAIRKRVKQNQILAKGYRPIGVMDEDFPAYEKEYRGMN